MKMLVLGATGMLGSGVCHQLKKEGFEVHGTFRANSHHTCHDLGLDKMIDFNAHEIINDSWHPSMPVTGRKISLKGYSCIINCIGIINTLSSLNKVDTTYINSLFPHLMARRCTEAGAKFIHITTDCVFNGEKGRYTEKSPHDAHDIYGKTKSIGEPDECMSLRTSIIGEEKHQYHSLISWAQSQKNKEVKGYTNHHWNGVTTHQYGKIISQIIKENLYQEDLFHVFSPNDVTKFDLLGIINDRFSLNLNITPHEAQPPINRTLRTTKRLQKILSIPSVEQQVKQL